MTKELPQLDDFHIEMSKALRNGQPDSHTYLPRKARQANSQELRDREKAKQHIVPIVAEVLSDEEIAAELRIPVDVVKEYINARGLRNLRSREQTKVKRTPEMVQALLRITGDRIIELRSKRWTAVAISEDIGLDTSTVELLIRKLIDDGRLTPRGRTDYNGNFKLPPAHRQKKPVRK